MTTKIYPSETGRVVNNGFDLSGLNNIFSPHIHIQGIAQAGDEYTILSTNKEEKELILAHGSGNQKKVVLVQGLNKGYEHAGGIGVLEVKNGWRIVVPVWSKDSDKRSAIIHYIFSEQNGDPKLTCCHITKLKGKKAYAAGIARTLDKKSVVIAVVVENDGKKVQFLKCDDPNGKGAYKKCGKVWKKKNADTDGWIDPNWGKHRNSISLIKYGGQIYFVGMHNTGKFAEGDDRVDIYKVNLKNKNWLTKTQKFHAICNEPPSFCWGGSARIHNGKVEILVVEKNVQENAFVKYDKFYLDIDSSGKLTPELSIEKLKI